MNWNRRQFLAAGPLAALGAPARAARHNVVFVVADDLNCSLGCYGNAAVRTPHLDRLASRGVVFDRAYCQFPLCAPSRASFLSGRRPERTRVWTLTTPTRQHMRDVTMLPELFRKHGYFSGQTGKIYHTGPEHEDPRSWDFALEESGKNPPPSEILEQHTAKGPRNHSMSWAKLRTPDAQTPDGMVARKAVELIRRQTAQQRPFFLGVGFRRPHSPYAAPRQYFDLYDPARISLPERGHPERLPPAAWYELDGQPPLSDREQREYIAAYYACVSLMDAQVGVILDALDEQKLWDQTVVVFVGDNGYHTGQHGMWHKMTLFEESLRVPLIVAAPGAKGAGKVCRGLFELIDIYPTLAEWCGLPAPEGLEGVSLVPWLQDPARPGKPAVYGMVGRHDNRELANKQITYLGKTVRTERWRYTEWDGGKRGSELYEVVRDPGEMQNRAGEAGQADTIAAMKRLLAAVDASARPQRT